MFSKRLTTKITVLIAIVAIAGFFIYKGTAGTMKIITTGSSTAKVNMPDTNRLASGLVGYWTFDGQDTNWTSATAGTVTDRSGQGNTGTLTNMSQSASPVIGKVGQALNFDGTNDYIDAGSGSSLDLTGSMTISAWVYSKGSGGVQGIMSKSYGCGEDYAFEITSANKLFYANIMDCINFESISTDSISLNQWQHVVFARNASNQITFYINGVQDSGGWQSVQYWPGDTSSVSIGKVTDANGDNFFNGYIDEVRIYNRALSASEITELYQQGQAKINASQAGKLTNGLVGYWTFDGQDTNWGTNTTNDRSGNSNTGTLTNMSTTTSPAPGVNGQALNFDGTNDYISVPDAPELHFGNNSMTICFWAKIMGNFTSNQYFINKYTGGNVEGFHLSYHQATKTFWVMEHNADNTASFSMYSTSANLNNSAWRHLCYSRDDSTGANMYRYIYVDGVQETIKTDTPIYNITTTDRMVIGAAYTNPDFAWVNGSMDEVRIYNRALSAAEILELYNAGR